MLFFAAAFKKAAILHNFSYAYKFTRKAAATLNVALPSTPEGMPDFEYMERYIRAMEKVVIADVVAYKNKVIEETKEVVGV